MAGTTDFKNVQLGTLRLSCLQVLKIELSTKTAKFAVKVPFLLGSAKLLAEKRLVYVDCRN
jgi:hypothetical protein